MGVPDFLKFAARVSPEALCRLPKAGNATPMGFDFILVDATNAFQTIGFQALSEFLLLPKLNVRRAVIFAMDAQRHRAGTARSHRTHATVLDADVSVQQLSQKLQEHYKQRGGEMMPQVLVSGRQIAGEADYKILDIQRNLVTQALAAGEKAPTFCFVSEDSDVLCGALCGPAPYSISIATKLHDTMFEMCILRLSHVLAYVAMCVDAIGGEGEVEQPAVVEKPAKKEKMEENNDNEEEKEAEEEEKNDKVEEEEVFRRKKQDGPMVATGTRVVLSDSDSDNDNDDNNNVVADKNNKSKESEEQKLSLTSNEPIITDQQIAAAEILQNSCVDLVFLFVVVMGNGSNVPPVIRGATKVDIQSCWKAYCRMKYETADPGREKEMGRNLLCLHDAVGRTEQQADRIASMTIDCSFLRSILEAAHYADAQSRPPVEEEKERALLFLSQAIYTTLRYIVACNVDPNAARHNTFLDARPLMETEVAVPSLAAFLWVLGQTRKKTLHFPLVGLATEEVLSSAARGTAAVESAVAVAAARARGNGNEQNIVLQWDVANTLMTPDVGLPRTVRLHKLLPNALNGIGKSFMDRLYSFLEKESGIHTEALTRKTKKSLLSSLVLVWQKTFAPYMSTLDRIARRVHVISPFTGSIVSGNATVTTKRKEVPTVNSSDVKMSYSFELRRMAPVLSGGGGEEKSLTAPTASAALLNALRVSYDYATAPQPPPGTVCVDDNTNSGRLFSKAGKGKKHMRGKDKTEGENVDHEKDADSAQKKKLKTGVSGNTTTPGSESGEVKSEKYRRPGKKEREKMKKKFTNSKSK
ncbi:uncharacterized protein TM35_000023610 [Trypanosoma theileri]|uniref:Uncharacterized protein n=1 Tax=Trypanosoma theileri TaxID=67003 RepID=A0A1X0P867_9TRYP|nr:uncharacterized protein TM35_000023610 [Trypanosoma theileri]ORC93035.1 hypothetical protein TM35_000023610 [Trypanosoma theileri]